MLLRVLSAALGIPLYIIVCLQGTRAFAIGISIFAIISIFELLKTYWTQKIRPSLFLSFLGLMFPAWTLLTPYFEWRHLVIFILSAVFFAIIWEVFKAGISGEMHAARNIGYGMLTGSYISLYGGLTTLRAHSGLVYSGLFPQMEFGAALVLLVALCTWATDTSALFVGKAWGKTKLAPHLSPHKTIEGAFGGLAGAIVAGIFFGIMLMGSWKWGMLVGIIAGIFGQIGDLFESALKREAGVKDFGNVVPGHGGALDRFDSLIFASGVLSLLVYLAIK